MYQFLYLHRPPDLFFIIILKDFNTIAKLSSQLLFEKVSPIELREYSNLLYLMYLRARVTGFIAHLNNN